MAPPGPQNYAGNGEQEAEEAEDHYGGDEVGQGGAGGGGGRRADRRRTPKGRALGGGHGSLEDYFQSRAVLCLLLFCTIGLSNKSLS